MPPHRHTSIHHRLGQQTGTTAAFPGAPPGTAPQKACNWWCLPAAVAVSSTAHVEGCAKAAKSDRL